MLVSGETFYLYCRAHGIQAWIWGSEVRRDVVFSVRGVLNDYLVMVVDCRGLGLRWTGLDLDSLVACC